MQENLPFAYQCPMKFFRKNPLRYVEINANIFFYLLHAYRKRMFSVQIPIFAQICFRFHATLFVGIGIGIFYGTNNFFFYYLLFYFPTFLDMSKGNGWEPIVFTTLHCMRM